MSQVPADIDADFQITYVFNGFENVGSTETILSGTQMFQNVDFISFSFAIILSFSAFRWNAPSGRPDTRNRCFYIIKLNPSQTTLFQGKLKS